MTRRIRITARAAGEIERAHVWYRQGSGLVSLHTLQDSRPDPGAFRRFGVQRLEA